MIKLKAFLTITRYRAIAIFFALLSISDVSNAQQSVARQWNEQVLEAIRNDFARPTVHARNLFHISMGMYDAWAAYEISAKTYFLGDTLGNYFCPFDGVNIPENKKMAQEEAMSYVAYRLISHRFINAPAADDIKLNIDALFADLGYDLNFTSTDYSTGNAAAFGNYIANKIIEFGMQDGANEAGQYANISYNPVNPALVIKLPGNPTLIDPNRWQPLSLDVYIDQSGNVIPINTPKFLGPEWGSVVPFSLKESDLTTYERDGFNYQVYHDPGPPPYLDTTEPNALSEEYKWGFELVAVWSSHLDKTDTTMWDISPRGIGNIPQFPESIEDYRDFYNLLEGGDPAIGRDINPVTEQPYEPEFVKRGDYARVLAEFWADGPDSETPPGHWFSLLNYVSDHPLLEKRFKGEGEIMDDLEWDVKSYFMLGGCMHDVAVTAWGLKGWYDYIRPVSAIRYMAELGQSSDSTAMNYHPGGIHLVPDYIEIVDSTDVLAGDEFRNVGKIKLYSWRGPDFIEDPEIDEAGVGWILAENWWPYQRPSFVTPPFAGYVSGHSTFSRAAAEMLTLLTGDEYFPGGLGTFDAPKNEFLVFEEGPSESVILQWATYRDASDQCSLSRIWGGIHPPADDIPGRIIGQLIGIESFEYAEAYFSIDEDNDGFDNVVDCDDQDSSIYPGALEICDGLDNDCDGMIDDSLDLFVYYQDFDGDGFGTSDSVLTLCIDTLMEEFVVDLGDCDDQNSNINPGALEICDGLDNDCDGMIDDSLDLFVYYQDFDGDGFGTMDSFITLCMDTLISGFVVDSEDCNDQDSTIYPGAPEILDNGIDEDCDGMDDVSSGTLSIDELTFTILPNPVKDQIIIRSNDEKIDLICIVSMSNRIIQKEKVKWLDGEVAFDVSQLQSGVYFIMVMESKTERMNVQKFLKL